MTTMRTKINHKGKILATFRHELIPLMRGDVYVFNGKSYTVMAKNFIHSASQKEAEMIIHVKEIEL